MPVAFQSDAFQANAFQTQPDVIAGAALPSQIVNPATGSLSLIFDPITRDLIDAADGWFLEGTDSRSIVLFQIESVYRAWWGDSTAGSNVSAILGSSGAQPEELRDELKRCLQALVNEGIVSELGVELDVDEAGRIVVLLNYRDRSSGQLVDLAYVPFGG